MLLKIKNTMPVVLATFFSNAALGIFLLNFGMLLFTRNGSTEQFTEFLIIEQLGLLFLGFFAGTLVSRYKAVHVACFANIGFSVTCLVVGGLLSIDRLQNELALILPLFAGLCFTVSRAFFRPALFTIPSEAVDNKNLHQLNVHQSIAIQSGQLVGAMVGGVLIEFFSTTTALYTSGIIYLLAAVFFFCSPAPYAKKPENSQSIIALFRKMPREWSNAMAVVWKNTHARYILLSVSADFFTISAFMLLLAPFVDQFLNGSGMWLGWLETSFALGAILGGLVSGRLDGSMSVATQRKLGLMIQIVAWPLLGVTSEGYTALFIALALGSGMVISSTAVITLLQRLIAKEYHSHMAVFRTMSISALLTSMLPLFSYMLNFSLLHAALLASALVTFLLVISCLSQYDKKECPA